MLELVTWLGHVDLVYIIASIWYPHHNKHCATLCLTSQPFIPSPIPQIIAGAHLLTFATHDTWRLHWPLRRKRVQTLHDSTNSCFAQNPFITHILLLSYLHDHIGGPINSNCFTFDFLLFVWGGNVIPNSLVRAPLGTARRSRNINGSFQHFSSSQHFSISARDGSGNRHSRHFTTTLPADVCQIHEQIKHAKRLTQGEWKWTSNTLHYQFRCDVVN